MASSECYRGVETVVNKAARGMPQVGQVLFAMRKEFACFLGCSESRS